MLDIDERRHYRVLVITFFMITLGLTVIPFFVEVGSFAVVANAVAAPWGALITVVYLAKHLYKTTGDSAWMLAKSFWARQSLLWLVIFVHFVGVLVVSFQIS